MAANIAIGLDGTDAAILLALQTNGRQSIADLARAINMSHSGTAERVRRLEETGVLAGYTATVSAEHLGYSIMAFLRLKYPSSRYEPLHRLLGELPQVIEAHHVTGEDCFILKVMATSMQDLERISGQVGTLGAVTTSVVYSTPLPARPLLPPAPG